MSFRRRQSALPFAAELGPLERGRVLRVQTEHPFEPIRLFVPTIPRGRLELAVAWLRHLLFTAGRNVRAVIGGGELWSWRLGPKVAPVTIDAISIDQTPCLVSGTPADLFAADGPDLPLSGTVARVEVSITVSNTSRKPFAFRASVIGWIGPAYSDGAKEL